MSVETIVGLAVVVAFIVFVAWRIKKSNSEDNTGTGGYQNPTHQEVANKGKKKTK